MKMQLIRTFLALAAVCPVHGVEAQEAHHTAGKLGTVHFKVGCNAAAQTRIRPGDGVLPLLRLGGHQGATRSHAASGRCLRHGALVARPRLARQPIRLARECVGQDAGRRRGADGAGTQDRARDQRERDYVDALAVFFQDVDKLNHRTRAKALESGLESVAAKYPEDTEAAILYSLVLSANFDPTDKQYNNQLRAAKLLEPIFAKQPEHPGAAHYLIHSYDYPPLAAQGLPAAQRYGKIAPARRARPAHAFAHLHPRRRVERFGRGEHGIGESRHGDGPQTLHAYDYMVYAHLQMGQDRAAQAVRDSANAMPMRPDNFAAAYAYAAIPARWPSSAATGPQRATVPLIPSADAYPWDKYPQAEASNAYARALGAAALQDAAAVASELARLQRLQDRASELRSATGSSRSVSRSTSFAALPLSSRVRWMPALRDCGRLPTARMRPRSTL